MNSTATQLIKGIKYLPVAARQRLTASLTEAIEVLTKESLKKTPPQPFNYETSSKELYERFSSHFDSATLPERDKQACLQIAQNFFKLYVKMVSLILIEYRKELLNINAFLALLTFLGVSDSSSTHLSNTYKAISQVHSRLTDVPRASL